MTFVLVWVNQLAGLATFYGGGDRREMFTFRPMGLRHRAQDGAAQ